MKKVDLITGLLNLFGILFFTGILLHLIFRFFEIIGWIFTLFNFINEEG